MTFKPCNISYKMNLHESNGLFHTKTFRTITKLSVPWYHHKILPETTLIYAQTARCTLLQTFSACCFAYALLLRSKSRETISQFIPLYRLRRYMPDEFKKKNYRVREYMNTRRSHHLFHLTHAYCSYIYNFLRETVQHMKIVYQPLLHAMKGSKEWQRQNKPSKKYFLEM